MAAQRVRYRLISNEDRGRLVDAFEKNNLNYIELADTLGIKRATARSIVATYLREGRRDKIPRGGARHAKWMRTWKLYIYIFHSYIQQKKNEIRNKRERKDRLEERNNEITTRRERRRVRECERGRHAETFKKKIEVELYSKGRSRTNKSSIKCL